jgi:hypothetical protein
MAELIKFFNGNESDDYQNSRCAQDRAGSQTGCKVGSILT